MCIAAHTRPIIILQVAIQDNRTSVNQYGIAPPRELLQHQRKIAALTGEVVKFAIGDRL